MTLKKKYDRFEDEDRLPDAGFMKLSRTASVLQFKLTKPESSGGRSPKSNHVCFFAKQRNRRNHDDQAKPESS